jgi:hypothetical protein
MPLVGCGGREKDRKEIFIASDKIPDSDKIPQFRKKLLVSPTNKQ